MDAKAKKDVALFAAKMRRHIVEQVFRAQSGHIGGSMSSTDILAVLYTQVMRVDPADPKKPDRDRFVLSKGHCSPALYAALALKGFFPEADLQGFRSIGSYLQGHPSMKDVPGVDMSTGSLGQGISAAVGMAIAGKLDNKEAVLAALKAADFDSVRGSFKFASNQFPDAPFYRPAVQCHSHGPALGMG